MIPSESVCSILPSVLKIPASSRNNHLQAILAGLETRDTAGGKTDIYGVLKRVNESLTRRSIVILMWTFCPHEKICSKA